MRKVLDFNAKTLLSGIVGRPREIAWPCEMFRVTLPHLNDDGEREFNAFELCVLKLLANGRYEPKDIADATCLPGDLIQIVLLRLYDRGKIDEHYQLLPDVQKAMEKLDGVSPYENAKYETYAIFRECIGGEVLPMIVEAKLKAEEVDEKGKIKGGKIFLESLHFEKKKVRAPDVPDVIVALRTMARRRRMSGETYRIPPAEFVAVADDFEKCELRVRMVMQESGEWRILNPFGNGWSPELEAVYQQLLQKSEDESSVFKAWERRFVRRQSDREQNELSQDRVREPYDTQENRIRYPELIGALCRKQTGIKGESVSAIDVYAVLEWALFYSLQLVDTKTIVQFLQVATREIIEREITVALTGMGGRLPENGRLPVPSNSQLNAFGYDDVARMQAVLPIAILAAAKNPNVRMEAVLRRYPDFVSRVMNFKNIRDLQRHAKIYWNEIYSDEDRDMMRQVVTSLIP